MSSLFLEPEEKIRFINWLVLTAETAKGMGQQMANIKVHEKLVKKEFATAAACLIVLDLLQNGESVTVGKQATNEVKNKKLYDSFKGL